MTKKQEEAPINWFPSMAQRAEWSKQFADVQAQKLKEAQAAHAQKMAEAANAIKMMQMKAAEKAKKTKK